MNRRTYAFLTAAIGSAITAWWWTRNQGSSIGPAPRERGTVIFDNTPIVSAEPDFDLSESVPGR